MCRRVAVLWLLFPTAAGAGDDLVKRWDNPPRITLKASRIRVDEAVDRIRKATEQEVVVGANGSQAIELDLKDATFFEAIAEVAQRAGLILTGSARKGHAVTGEDSTLRLERMPDEMKRMGPVVSGPAQISLTGVFTERNAARLFSPEGSREDDAPRKLWIEMRVLVEGGLGDAILQEIRVEHAPDDADKNLAGTKSLLRECDIGTNLRIELEAASSSSLLVRSLDGRAVFLVPVETTTLKFTAGSRNAAKKLGDAKFTFKRLDRKGEDGKPEMAVTLEGLPCADLGSEDQGSWGLVRIMTNRWGGFREGAPPVGIYLYDRSDNPIGASSSFSSTADNESRFTLDEVPARIEVRAITRVEKREIPFRFNELPIPR